MIHWCICKGCLNHPECLDSITDCKTTNTLDIVLLVTVMWESKNEISDEFYYQNWSEWCHMSHRWSGQCRIWICPNDDHHTASLHLSSCITFRTDLAHLAEIFTIAYGMLWKLRRRSWMRKAEEVGQYESKPGWMICMPSIASRKRGNVDWTISSFTQITWIVVDTKLRGNNIAWCKSLYRETPYWRSIMTIQFFAFNYWEYGDFLDLFNLSVNGVSTIFSLTLLAINGLQCHILPQ